MGNNYEFDMNQIMPLREEVFHTLRQAILKGEMKPGYRLREISLSNELGVSRTPVLDAIRMLEQEGLVVMEANKGAYVAEISKQELNDVLELRRSLEALAIEKASERISEKELKMLDQAAEEFARLAASDRLMELAEADVRFHDVIYRATHNRRLVQLLNNLRELMYRFRMEYLKDQASRTRLAQEHEAIRQALHNKDAKSAHEAICEHIDNQWVVVIRSLKE